MRDLTNQLLDEVVYATSDFPPGALNGLTSSLAGEPVNAFLYFEGLTVDHDAVADRRQVAIVTPTRLIHTGWVNEPADAAPDDTEDAEAAEIALLNGLLSDQPPAEGRRVLRVTTSSVALSEIAEVRTDSQYAPDGARATGTRVIVFFKTLGALQLGPQGCGDEECTGVHGYEGAFMQDYLTYARSDDDHSAEDIQRVATFGGVLSVAVAARR